VNRSVVLGALATLIACVSDSSDYLPTNPAGCDRGSIAAGETKFGQTDAGDCVLVEKGLDVYFEQYVFPVVAGRTYLVTLRNTADTAGGPADDFDVVLEMYGDGVDAFTPLVKDDDEGGGLSGHDAEFYFAAPVSGIYELRVRGFTTSDTGTYALTVRSCGDGRLAGGTVSGRFDAATDCVLHHLPATADSGRADLYSIVLQQGETRRFTLETTAGIQPELGVSHSWANIDWHADAWISQATITMTAQHSGVYVVVAGGFPASGSGDYTLSVEAVSAPDFVPATTGIQQVTR
jgi:hypothetical protein